MAEINYREAIRQALREEMQRDERVLLLGEDIGPYGGAHAVTRGLLEEFGEKRVRDTPIAESVIIGASVGAAMAGLRPVAEMMSINFSLLAMDQIVNHAAKIRYMSGGQFTVPLVIRAVTGAGNQLGAQHSQSLEGWFAHVPGLIVVAPSTPYDAKGLLKTAVRDDNPVMFVEHTLLYNVKDEVPEGDYMVPIGSSVVRRTGNDVTLVGYLRMAHVALAAAGTLARRGVSAEVIDLRSLQPLDMMPVLESLHKTNRLVVVEEAGGLSGIASHVTTIAYSEAFDDFDAPAECVTGADIPMPYAKHLEQAAIPSEEEVIRAVGRMIPKAAQG